MSLFKGEEEGEEEEPKELSRIVLEMLINNEPEEKIIESLKSTGIDEEDAKEVYKKISKDYYHFMEEELNDEVKELFDDHKEEIIERFSKKVKDTLEETELKIDLRFTEIKDQVNSNVESAQEDIEENEESIKQLRRETERGYNQLKKNMKSLEFTGPLKGIVPAMAITIGALIIVYSLTAIPDIPHILKEPLSVSLMPLAIVILAISAGIILIGFGAATIVRIRRLKMHAFGEEEK